MEELSDEQHEDFEEYLWGLIVAGYADFEDVVTAAEEWLEFDAEVTVPEGAAEEFVGRLWDERVAEQAAWTGTTDPERVTRAFEALADRGLIARENFACCTRCGVSEIRETAAEGARGYVFFHAQRTEAAAAGHGLTLYFGGFERPGTVPGAAGRAAGTVEIGHEVVAALRAAGLTPHWDGTATSAVEVRPLVWHRRLPARG
ncbi:hypothetical protein [Streptomyces sp. NPDC005805]|uniref:DUF6891 domain-containing protein n=1 Tax=Streptomyces sp. NPDC005805 TaxID=3157068 RepID=UPI0033DC50B9